MSVKALVQPVAAIDVGSNAMRLVIANVDRDGELQPVVSLREPVRLGRDVFAGGVISESTTERALEAFGRFKAAIDQHGVNLVRAVGTSALREAHNRELFVDRVERECGLQIEIIGGEEEARLISLAVGKRISLRNRLALLIDIGGGSVEITLLRNGDIEAVESINMGTVRMLSRMKAEGSDDRKFHRLVREYAEISRHWLEQAVGDEKIDLLAGTGGNVEALADLRVMVMGGGTNGTLAAADLDQLLKRLQETTLEERIEKYKMRPDRADVIMPAAIVLHALVQQARVGEIHVPKVGLKDGVLYDLAQEVTDNKKGLHQRQVLASALQLGRKYSFDEAHGQAVARLTVELFDKTRDLHHMGEESRLLLEVAALLHDVGHFVNVSGHHKHTQYILMASPIVGLSDHQRSIVANVARYHRKSNPTLRHEPFRVLQPKERLEVTRLAVLLRLGDAMDAEHAGRVSGVSVEFKRPRLSLKIQGQGDLLLEKWSLNRKAPLFEEVFAVKLSIES